MTLEEMADEAGMVTGENLRRDGYMLYRSVGEQVNVRSDHLEHFADLVRARDARRIEVLQHERDHARAQFESAVRLLTGIHSLLYPAPVKMDDGRTMVFRPENAHEFMQALSDRIRAMPDELAALKDRPQG